MRRVHVHWIVFVRQTRGFFLFSVLWLNLHSRTGRTQPAAPHPFSSPKKSQIFKSNRCSIKLPFQTWFFPGSQFPLFFPCIWIFIDNSRMMHGYNHFQLAATFPLNTRSSHARKKIHPNSNQSNFASSHFWKSDGFLFVARIRVLPVAVVSHVVERRTDTNKKRSSIACQVAGENERKKKAWVVRAEVFPNIPILKITSNFNLVHTARKRRHILGSFASSKITSEWKWIAKYAKRSVNNYIMYGKHHANGRTLCWWGRRGPQCVLLPRLTPRRSMRSVLI